MITVEMAKEFARDYLGTLKAKGLKNTFRSTMEIARIMGIDFNKACRFVTVAKENRFMCADAYSLPRYMAFPTLFKVWEEHITV